MISQSDSETEAETETGGAFDVHNPRYSRILQFVGEDGLQRLHRARVLVVGLGAVGSYAVEGLARAGIGNLRLVDFDTVSASNINRQLYALESTVNRLKCDVARERVADINPDCRVEALKIFVHADTMEEIFAEFEPDFVVDAIDSLEPKVELIAAVCNRGIPFISSMGAALRTDPTQIRIGLLSEVIHCPLARMVRKRFRRRGISADCVCVHSSEDISAVRRVCLGAPEPPTFERRGRARHVLGSLPTITGIFGLTIANYVIQKICFPEKNLVTRRVAQDVNKKTKGKSDRNSIRNP